MERKDFGGAINRFKVVVTHTRPRVTSRKRWRGAPKLYGARIVPEAQTAAAVLGHKFRDSRWTGRV